MYSIHFFPQALATPTLTVIYAWVHIWITITIFRQRFFAIWFLCICCRLGVFNTKLSWEAVLTILFQWGSGGHKVFILDQILEEWPWGTPLGYKSIRGIVWGYRGYIKGKGSLLITSWGPSAPGSWNTYQRDEPQSYLRSLLIILDLTSLSKVWPFFKHFLGFVPLPLSCVIDNNSVTSASALFSLCTLNI